MSEGKKKDTLADRYSEALNDFASSDIRLILNITFRSDFDNF